MPHDYILSVMTNKVLGFVVYLLAHINSTDEWKQWKEDEKARIAAEADAVPKVDQLKKKLKDKRSLLKEKDEEIEQLQKKVAALELQVNRAKSALGAGGPSTGSRPPNIPELQKGDKTCPVCAKEFQEAWKCKDHYNRKHCGFGKHQCDICEKTFQTLGNLESHMKSHTEENLYGCAECNTKCTTPQALQSHIQIQHPKPKQGQRAVEAVKIVCEHPGCDREFKAKKYMEEHMQVCPKNPNPLQLKCSFCTKVFNQPKKLNLHMRKMHEYGKGG
jgi:hypothetical protein